MKRQILSIITLITLSPAIAQTSKKKPLQTQNKTIVKAKEPVSIPSKSNTMPLETTSVATKSVFQKIKDSPFDLTFNFQTATKRDGLNKIEGYDQTNRMFMSYKLSPKDKIKTEIRTIHSKLNNSEMVNSVNRTTAKYTRSSIMNQANHGVDLSASVEYRYLPDRNVRIKNHRYSHVRLGPTLARSWGNIAADGGVFYTFFQTNDQLKNRQTNSWYMPFTQSYKITDKLKTYILEEMTYTNTANNLSETLTLDLTAEAGYQFNPDFYLGFSVAGQPVLRTDKTEAKGWSKKLIYAVNFDLAVF